MTGEELAQHLRAIRCNDLVQRIILLQQQRYPAALVSVAEATRRHDMMALCHNGQDEHTNRTVSHGLDGHAPTHSGPGWLEAGLLATGTLGQLLGGPLELHAVLR